MGEIAEMMLDGTLCTTCGTYLGDDSGIPTQCDDCEAEEMLANAPKPAPRPPTPPTNKPEKTVPCPDCKKMFASHHSMAVHRHMKHRKTKK